ncbi:GNAT family N-acetyltransferase [Actinophytocola gossypii]|uniref:GNAT family N-acetyltransferase n=1 Tax=Actinophytocola gossypii TaxID=2812003 RepID=A0ABT2J5U0_9PSEU|nr:GNAT family N-acetyltransferase [Actinophytocola gossypii]MCT2583232.1 GNAT family N-acetyltransferase [Actinophytocola gossypii]
MRTLHTARLTLRPIRAEDTAALTELFADPEVSRFHPAGFPSDDLHRADRIRPDQVAALVRRRLDYRGPVNTGDWVFVLDGHVVGIGHARISTEFGGGVVEVGWCVAREHWESGLAEEAARAIVGYGHHTLGAAAVFALVHDGDARGRAFAEQLGFIDVGAGEHYGATHRVMVCLASPGGVHHVELWVADLVDAEASLGWLLTELGWREYQRWPRGVSWRHGASYVVVEDSPERRGDVHDRMTPGLNHLALHIRTRAELDRLTAVAPEHGWRIMFADKHPYAGGPEHYATYLENDAGFEVELVAGDHVV